MANTKPSTAETCDLFYFCGGRSLLCRGSRLSCWSGCPPKEVLRRIEELEQGSFSDEGRWTYEQLREVLLEGASTVSVALVDARIVAYALFRSVPPEGELLRLAVDERYLRQGYGKLLLQDGLKMLAEKGIQEVFLEVAESNVPALQLYSTFGFIEAGRRPDYYPHLGVDGIVMRYDIVPSESTGKRKSS